MAQLVMIAASVNEPNRTLALVRDQHIGGLLLRGTFRPATSQLLASLTAAGADLPPILAVDEEGGRVQHLRLALGRIPSARVMASTMTAAAVRDLARRHGEDMRAFGFTMDFAPVVDLSDANDAAIGDRSFSANPAVTTTYALAFARGLIDAGIMPVVKHFPGHGRASGDSHQLEPVTPPLGSLRGFDFVPFAQITRSAPVGVMVGHLAVPELDGYPASISPAAHAVLRDELGFKGLVVSDSLSMWPIRARLSAPRAAEAALRAGSDLVLFDETRELVGIIDGLVRAAEADPVFAERTIDAAVKVLAAKGRRRCPGTPVGTATVAGSGPTGAATVPGGASGPVAPPSTTAQAGPTTTVATASNTN